MGRDRRVSDDETVMVLADAIDLVGDSDPPLRARLLAALSAELTFVDADRRQTLSETALEIARRLFEEHPSPANRSTLARVLEHRHTILLDAAGLSQRVEVIAELDSLAADASAYRAFNASSYGCWTAMEMGDLIECRRRIRTIRDTAEQLGQPRLIAVTRLWESVFAMVRGMASEALRLAAESHSIYLRVGRRDALVFNVGLRYLPSWFRGELSGLIDDLGDCAEAYPLRVRLHARPRPRTGAGWRL